MSSKAEFKDGNMEYTDENGNSFYKKAEDVDMGIKGTLLPESNRDASKGGSTGFDIHQKVPVITNPDYPESTSMREVGGTEEEQGSMDDKKDYKKSKPKNKQAKKKTTTRKGKSKGGKKSSPTLEREEDKEESKREDEEFKDMLEEEESREDRPLEPIPAEDEDTPADPMAHIVFHLGEGIGDFDCFYHRIFKDGVSLVLVWDNRYHGSRYMPASSPDKVIQVTVGEEREKLNVFVGPRFTDDYRDEEYTILFVTEE